MSELGPVVIGARELYDLGQATKQAVDSLAGDVRGLAGDLVEVRADIADHEHRLRSVERSRWPLSPANMVTAGLAVLALAVEVVPRLVK
jgi:hypothetical protein